jgi:hypothetical protein
MLFKIEGFESYNKKTNEMGIPTFHINLDLISNIGNYFGHNGEVGTTIVMNNGDRFVDVRNQEKFINDVTVAKAFL